jgi:CubicO group peptidase (beta-lactamase class C family)
MGPNEAAFGHDGYGGSLGFADPTASIGFGFVTNSIPPSRSQDHRATKLIRSVYESL